MKRAVLFLATGFEELEAVDTVNILRRGGVETTIVSITGSRSVCGARGIEIIADSLFEQTDFDLMDAFILPGGLPGSNNLNDYKPLKDLLTKSFNDGRLIAAICAAPLVLGGLGLLKDRKAICYPSFESHLKGATICDQPVVCDGNVITGKGPGLVFDFGLTILEYLIGSGKSEEVAEDLLLKE